jgi:hypothetical protein
MDPAQFPQKAAVPELPSFIERLKAERAKHQSAIDYLDNVIRLYETSENVRKFVTLSESK